MRTLKFASLALLIVALTTTAAGQGFQLYPGATKSPNTKAPPEVINSLPPGTTTATYLTKDSFEKVVAFYKGFAREYRMPSVPGGVKLPTGQEMQQTFLILDGAADITTSKRWVTVQHPFVGSVDFKGGAPAYSDIRDITAIVFTENK
jgi:hypothetical protein